MYPDKYERKTDEQIERTVEDLNRQASELSSRHTYTYEDILNRFKEVDGLKHNLKTRGYSL